MKAAIALMVLLISASIAKPITMQSEALNWINNEETTISSTFSSNLATVSAREWKASALEKAKNKLHMLKKELRRLEIVYRCEKEKSSILQALYRKKKSFRCLSYKKRNVNGCHRMHALRKEVKHGQKMCRKNRSCKKKYVWPLQWKLKMLSKSCNCEKGVSLMKMIWRAKEIRCGKGRNAWKVRSEIRRLENRISYLEETLIVKPSVAPRPKRD